METRIHVAQNRMNLLGSIDGTEYMEGGFVGRLKTFEQVKSICPDRFEAAVTVTRKGAERCHAAQEEPVWKGTRKYLVTAAKSGRIDSTLLESDDRIEHPPAKELGDFFGRHMKPFRMNVAYFTGHGRGDAVGETTTREIGEILQRAAAVSGEKPGIVFIEACAAGHLDGLRPLQGKAGFALVTEETIPQDALPLGDMLKKAMDAGGSPEDAARALVRAAAGKRGVRTFAAVNLEKIEPLGLAVDRLKQLLIPQMATDGGMKKVRAAIKASYYALPIAREFGFGDLGEFLRSISCGKYPAEIHEAAADASRKLDDAVIEKTADPNYNGISGLSFDTKIGGTRFSWQDLFFD